MMTRFEGALAAVALMGGLCHAATPGPVKKVGVLMVNHGSRSETWRKALLSLEDKVRAPLTQDGTLKTVKTAFMEYTEPSIATRLKEFDAEGYTDVVMVPVFLTVSPHSFDDIPTIIGRKTDPKSMEMLKIERIERYTPRARVQIAPLLDFTGLVRNNVLRRVRELSKDPSNEGLVLIAYGDETYEEDWVRLLSAVGEHVKKELGITAYSHGWCGHIAHYDPKKTTAAVEQVLTKKKRALVVPVLVAFDEMFQGKIIADGVAAVPQTRERVTYRPDAILPDPEVEAWVIKTAREQTQRVLAEAPSR